MGRNRFVTKDTVRLELSEGDWIEIKRRLNYGETQRLAQASFGNVNLQDVQTGKIELKLTSEDFNLTRFLIWLVDWSFVDERGKPVRITRDSIAMLDAETIAEIDAAITSHLDRESEKNAPEPGKTAPETI